MRHSILIAVIATAIAFPTFAKAPVPKITEAAARATALKLVPRGIVKASELETENHHFIYSYDISQPGKSGIEEIQISAITGKLVSRHHETPAKEAREAAADALAAKHK